MSLTPKKSILGTAFLISCFNQAHSAEQYPNLHENLVTSENYELVKVVDGSVNALFFNKKTQQIIVEANKKLLKIDKKGIVIDSIIKHEPFFASGYAFNLDDYNDWIFTGDKYNKKYDQQIDARKYSIEQLTTLFDSAEIVEFSQKRDKSYAHLYNSQQVTLVDISGRSDLIHNRCDINDRRYTYMNWEDVCFENYKRNENLFIFEDSFLWGWSYIDNAEKNEGINHGIEVVKFKRRKYYLDEGVSGQLLSLLIVSLYGGSMPSRYWYGDAYFNIKHQNETLKFKVFANNRNNRIEHYNLSAYQLPDPLLNDIKLIRVDYFSEQHMDTVATLNNYYNKDVGLYILRKKGSKQDDIVHARKAKWQLSYLGIKGKQPPYRLYLFQR
jgi:hypothetical protein